MKNPLARLLNTPTLAEQLQAAGVRADLVRAVSQTAFGRQTDRDLMVLAGLLDDDEAVIRLMEGRLHRSIGLLTLTSRRLMFLPRGAGTPTEIALAAVHAAVATQQRGMGRLVLTTDGGELVIDQILGIQAGWMSDDISGSGRTPGAVPPPTRDPLEELAELRALHASGVVDDREYELRKRELFGRL